MAILCSPVKHRPVNMVLESSNYVKTADRGMTTKSTKLEPLGGIKLYNQHGVGWVFRFGEGIKIE